MHQPQFGQNMAAAKQLKDLAEITAEQHKVVDISGLCTDNFKVKFNS